MPTIVFVTFAVGLGLIVVAVLGGGFEVKEIKIPSLTIVPRMLSFAVGCVLIALCLWAPQVFPPPTPPPPKLEVPSTAANLGAAIRNHLITVGDVKRVLKHLGKYNGPIDDEPNTSYFQAVGDFQLANNIAADGLVGPETLAKLREAWPEFFSAQEVRTGPQSAPPLQPVPPAPTTQSK
jgi:hypothetical protein